MSSEPFICKTNDQTHIYLNPSVFHKTFDSCKMISKPFYVANIIPYHPNINIKLITQTYLGMGHYGSIIDDSKGFYHSVILGGNSSHERFYNTISFTLYSFDNPCGKISDLKNNPNIIFHWLEMSENVKKIYTDMIMNKPCITTGKEFYNKMCDALQKLLIQ
jgi:hypothetical protein